MCDLEIVYSPVYEGWGVSAWQFTSDFDPVPCHEAAKIAQDKNDEKEVHSVEIYLCAIAKALVN